MSDLELERSLVPFGYSMMFADRDSVEEAFLYLNDIAQATDSAPHVITACMVYVNSLVKALHSNGQLNMDVKPDLEMMTEERDHLLSENIMLKGALVQIASDKSVLSGSNPHAHLFTRIAKEALEKGEQT